MKYNGLTSDEVKELVKNGKTNYVKRQSNQTYLNIFIKNIFTYFNFIFGFISVLLIVAGAYRNLTFLPVVIANIFIGIFQQIRSKIVLDRLSLLDKSEYYVVRDGKEVKITMDELVLGDLVKVSSGKQIPADGIVIDGDLLVNESLLTGEADEIEKSINDELKSGSFIISGEAYIKLIRVGVDSYSAKLMLKAKEIKDYGPGNKNSRYIYFFDKDDPALQQENLTLYHGDCYYLFPKDINLSKIKVKKLHIYGYNGYYYYEMPTITNSGRNVSFYGFYFDTYESVNNKKYIEALRWPALQEIIFHTKSSPRELTILGVKIKYVQDQ